MGLVAPQHVGSSRSRDRTHVSCIGRWILNHCTTREVPTTINILMTIFSCNYFPLLYSIRFLVAMRESIIILKQLEEFISVLNIDMHKNRWKELCFNLENQVEEIRPHLLFISLIYFQLLCCPTAMILVHSILTSSCIIGWLANYAPWLHFFTNSIYSALHCRVIFFWNAKQK